MQLFGVLDRMKGMLNDNAVTRMAALLRERRMQRRISQRQLADWAGVNVSVVSRAEKGEDAQLSTWDKLFRGLGELLEFGSTHSSADRLDGAFWPEIK